MARHFSLKTGCKVNLYLRIIKQRSDGFHIIDSIFFPLSRPADHMDIIETTGQNLTVKCCPPELENRQNILHKAYEQFASGTGFSPGLKVFLHKNVPVGAGLGGGSANAAAMLVMLNRMAGARSLSHERLMILASRIGADVPFFISGKPARARGIGDVLSPFRVDLRGMHMVLICPGIKINTAWAYRQWDQAEKNTPTSSPGLTIPRATDNDSRLEDRLILYNSFEKVVFRFFPEIRNIKTSMLENGAAACVLSGSGSSLTALFRNKADACRSCGLLSRRSIPFYFYYL